MRVVAAAGAAGAVVAGTVDGVVGVGDGAAGVVGAGADGLAGAVVVVPDVPIGCEAGRDGAADGVWAIAGAALSSNSKEQEQQIDVFIANILYWAFDALPRSSRRGCTGRVSAARRSVSASAPWVGHVAAPTSTTTGVSNS